MQKFNVGDKVKVVKNSFEGFWEPGHPETLTVIEIEDDSGIVNRTTIADVNHPYGLEQMYDESDLELIQAVKE